MALVAVLAGGGFAGEGKAVPAEKPVNLKVAFLVRARDLESAGNFVVRSGEQSSYTKGGETPFEVESPGGRGVEYKKHAVVVNCVPLVGPGPGLVSAQLQIELSGPLRPSGALQARPVETFQLQTTFTVRAGTTIVLVDEPDRRVEVTITPVEP